MNSPNRPKSKPNLNKDRQKMLKLALENNRQRRTEFLDKKRDYVAEFKSRQQKPLTSDIDEQEMLQIEQELLEDEMKERSAQDQYLYSEEEIIELLIQEYENNSNT